MSARAGPVLVAPLRPSSCVRKGGLVGPATSGVSGTVHLGKDQWKRPQSALAYLAARQDDHRVIRRGKATVDRAVPYPKGGKSMRIVRTGGCGAGHIVLPCHQISTSRGPNGRSGVSPVVTGSKAATRIARPPIVTKGAEWARSAAPPPPGPRVLSHGSGSSARRDLLDTVKVEDGTRRQHTPMARGAGGAPIKPRWSTPGRRSSGVTARLHDPAAAVGGTVYSQRPAAALEDPAWAITWAEKAVRPAKAARRADRVDHDTNGQRRRLKQQRKVHELLEAIPGHVLEMASAGRAVGQTSAEARLALRVQLLTAEGGPEGDKLHKGLRAWRLLDALASERGLPRPLHD